MIGHRKGAQIQFSHSSPCIIPKTESN